VISNEIGARTGEGGSKIAFTHPRSAEKIHLELAEFKER
jgi:hypothetical protein